jgi:mRNA-degrading endonuclease RelE of RelBE toxin-antitoxin system
MPRLELSPRFEKLFARLHPDLREAAARALQKLLDNPESRGLNLEPIAGEMYSIRVNRGFRILLRKRQDGVEVCYVAEDVGSHDIYRRSR